MRCLLIRSLPGPPSSLASPHHMLTLKPRGRNTAVIIFSVFSMLPPLSRTLAQIFSCANLSLQILLWPLSSEEIPLPSPPLQLRYYFLQHSMKTTLFICL